MSELITRAEQMRDLAAVRKMAELAYYAYQRNTLAMQEKVNALIGQGWGYAKTHPEVISANLARQKWRDVEFQALDFIAEINDKYDLLLRETVEELTTNPDALAEALTMLEIKALPLPIEDLIKGGKAF